MVLLEFSMSPLTKGENVSPFVARSVDIIDKSGLPYQLTAMGTILEGERDDVIAVAAPDSRQPAANWPRLEIREWGMGRDAVAAGRTASPATRFQL